MKKLKIILFILIILLIILISYFIINYKIKESKISYKDEITINVGDNMPTIDDYVDKEDLSKLTNTKLNWKDINIEDNKIYYVGIYSGTFEFNNKKYNIKLNVIDKIAPTITGVKDIEIYVDDEIDLLKDIKVEDNSHEDIKATVEGEYDLTKKGEYTLNYVATDSSKNTTKEEFKLKVKEKVVTIQNTSTSTTNKAEVVGTTTKGYKIEKINGSYYINGILIANKTYSLSNNYAPGGLLSVFTTNFNKMKNAASKEGINLYVISGYRSYNTQVTLYNNYVKRDGKAAADRYSSRAGHSEHQTGLTADINSVEQSFINTKEGKWLNENCYKYGFIIRYPNGKEDITGYMYEPWHIRYVGVDIATALYNNGNWISLEEYLGITSKYD